MKTWWSGKSIRTRLAVVFTLALFLVHVPYGAALYLMMRAQLNDALNLHLQSEFEEAAFVMAEISPARGRPVTDALRELERVEDVRYQLWNENQELAYQDRLSALARQALPPPGRRSPGEPYSAALEDGRFVRVIEAPLDDAEGLYLRTVIGEDELHATLITLFWVLVLGLVGLLGAAAATGYLVAGWALIPVRLITERARVMTVDRLREGIPVQNPGDELGRLSQTFNDLFARLDGSFSRLRQFSADASHELRTPLTVIRAVAEVNLERSESEAQQRCLESILEEVQHTSSILDALLLLARAEADEIQLAPVDLAALTRDAAGDLAILAEEKEQSLEVLADSAVMTLGDPFYVRQAILNIVDNAIKYSPEKTAVKVEVDVRGQWGVLRVSDAGPGIAAEHQARIFERFYRVNKDRGAGCGLGLSIASWVVQACGGRIELESTDGQGSTFSLFLPKTDGPARG